MTETTDMELINQIPKPDIQNIRLLKVEEIAIPHPYCITPKHIAYASDHNGGRLDTKAITEAEKHGGAVCDICKNINKKQGKPILPYSEHEQIKTLFIKVPQNKDLNAIGGLHDYLLKIKPIVEGLGIKGFAFPDKE